MLMVGFRGLEVGLGDEIARQIREFHLGGVILFDFDVPSQTAVRNISSPDQLRRLIASLQKLGPPPLLIGIEQEWDVSPG